MSEKLRLILQQALYRPEEVTRFSTFLNVFLATMVVLNIFQVVWLSIPEYALEYETLGVQLEVFFVLAFCIEYISRIWAAGDRDGNYWTEKWRYIKSPMGLVDLFSFLPILLFWLTFQETSSDLRALKLIAIIRILKLTRYSSSLSVLARLYRENQHTLIAAAMVMLIMSFLAATGVHLFERHVQPEVFGSIPDCMWWALVTLTTVGYGDMVPVTVGGKLFGVLVMISGVGVAAVPAGIFASSFVQLLREQDRQRRLKLRKLKAENTDPADLGFYFSKSEQHEVDYLMAEFGLNFEQAAGVVMHYRH